MRLTRIIALLILVGTALPATAKNRTIAGFSRGKTFFVLLPANIGEAACNLRAPLITEKNGSILINGSSLDAWRRSEPPAVELWTVKKVKYKKNNGGRVILTFEGERSTKLQVVLAPATTNWRARLRGTLIFIDGKNADAAKDTWLQTFIDTRMRKDVPGLFEHENRAVLRTAWSYWAVISRNIRNRLSTVKTSDNIFLEVEAGDDGVIYNSQRVSKRGMIARRLSPELVKEIKGFYPVLRGIRTVTGVKILFSVPYRDFAAERQGERHIIRCYLEVRKGDLHALSNLEITGQQLLDRSMLVCDGTRIKVDLNGIR